MTTKVLIANHGPDTVVIVTAPGLGLGNLTIPDQDACTRQELAPGEFREVYVHQTQSFMVLERKREP